MMRKFFGVILGMALVGPLAAADQYGNNQEAEAMVKKAVAFYNSAGHDKAVAAFNDPSTPDWHDRDLYVIMLDSAAKTVAHLNPKLVGKDLSEVKDVDGKFFSKEMVATALNKGKGWIDYKFTDPVTKKTMPKSTYCEKAGNNALCVGVYKR